MAHRRILCLLLLCMVSAGAQPDASAQGFSALTGRNHPELKWLEAETAHFRIMYPAHLAGIEVPAGTIAEESYEALSVNLGVTFDKPIRIYLSDEDEITNGFASRLGDGWTSIWVRVADVANWTGPESWLRRVISHEIAHIFHYRAVRSNIGLFDLLFARPLPRFWTEGLAQYQTEQWDAYRGDIWLRTAVLDDKLSYTDGRSARNGRLLYAVGNSQVRFLADSRGDSTLTKILAHRRPALLGLAKVHDFRAAFKAVTGESYRDFYDRWRRHVNVYYNTVAGQAEPIDSLDATELDLPGQYLYDIHSLADGRNIILYLESVDRPVTRLAITDSSGRAAEFLAEGTIRPPVSTTPDGRLVAFARRGRLPSGSLMYDLHLADTRTNVTRRLTFEGRVSSPALSPDGRRVAFVRNEEGGAAIFLADTATGHFSRVTESSPDRQVSHLRWHPSQNRIAYYVFDETGQRRIEAVSLDDGAIVQITDGSEDDRAPVWSPDGRQIGFTSLRDQVPNIFVADVESGSVRRVTHLATGASLTDWSTGREPGGDMIAIVAHSKERDRAYSLNGARTSRSREISVSPGYESWTSHTPPKIIPQRIPADPEVVRSRDEYNSWKNISHVASIGLPYFNSTRDWGLGGGTLWIEPLGKHVVGALAGLSVADPDNSFFAFTYLNNQLRPSLALTASRFPDVGRPYGEDILREDWTNISLAALWPVDRWPRPYTSTRVLVWARHYDVTPLNASAFADRADGLPVPEAGRQTSVRISLRRRTLRPYRDNQTHPLDGWGLRSRVTAAVRGADFDQGYLRYEGSAYMILRGPERHRLFVHGRFRSQRGTSLPQDFVGLSRYDAIQVDAGGLITWVSSESDRVRGYRRIAIGSNVLFGSIEYRVPLVPSLRTELLGLLSLGSTTLSPFFDAGYVWTRPNGRAPVGQYGAGIEIKNTLRIFGAVELTHAIGFAQPASSLFSDDRYEVYYRIRSALPF